MATLEGILAPGSSWEFSRNEVPLINDFVVFVLLMSHGLKSTCEKVSKNVFQTSAKKAKQRCKRCLQNISIDFQEDIISMYLTTQNLNATYRQV